MLSICTIEQTITGVQFFIEHTLTAALRPRVLAYENQHKASMKTISILAFALIVDMHLDIPTITCLPSSTIHHSKTFNAQHEPLNPIRP